MELSADRIFYPSQTKFLDLPLCVWVRLTTDVVVVTRHMLPHRLYMLSNTELDDGCRSDRFSVTFTVSVFCALTRLTYLCFQETVNPRDIMTDTVHSFHPQYSQHTHSTAQVRTYGVPATDTTMTAGQ